MNDFCELIFNVFSIIYCNLEHLNAGLQVSEIQVVEILIMLVLYNL